MAKIFISYRRDDSRWETGAIQDKLRSRLPRHEIYFDVDSIPPGQSFRTHLETAVGECDYVLAVVGESWVGAVDEKGRRRLDNPNDWVRIELEAALARGIPVIPVLLGTMTMPDPAELPESLKDFSERQAVCIRPHPDFDHDIAKLARAIEMQEAQRRKHKATSVLPAVPKPSIKLRLPRLPSLPSLPSLPRLPRPSRKALTVTTIAGGLIALLAIAYQLRPTPKPASAPWTSAMDDNGPFVPQDPDPAPTQPPPVATGGQSGAPAGSDQASAPAAQPASATAPVLPPPPPPVQRARTITNAIGMTLAWLPAGEFLMGSDETVADLERHFPAIQGFSNDAEHPQHLVRITRPFFIGAHEVTRGQFAQFVAETSYRTEAEVDGKGGERWFSEEKQFRQDPTLNWRKAGIPQTDEHPVVHVSWNDALAFCDWLRKKDDLQYQLPTEAQWEYACRAGTTTEFSVGDDPSQLAGVANLTDGTIPVGSLKPNGFGLYDMHGNVFEWCIDSFLSYANSPTDDPLGSSAGDLRSVRGGAWLLPAIYCRSAHRSWRMTSHRSEMVGFRVCADPDSKAATPAAESPAPVPPAPAAPATEDSASATTNSIGMKLTWVPSGEFWMGSDETKADLEHDFQLSEDFSNDDERPKHLVQITQPFFIGTYEVTRGQFKQFIDETGKLTEAETDGQGGDGWDPEAKKWVQDPKFNWHNLGFNPPDDFPVVNVTRGDAKAFCDWLSKKDHRTYRLPTEAQWEYACRAGSTTRFCFGDDPKLLPEYGHVFTVPGGMSPVGKFRPNAFGLYDMHGNVKEFCGDWYDSTYYAQSPKADPPGPASGQYCIARGGSAAGFLVSCRSAYRSPVKESYRTTDFGFRVVLVP